MFEQFQGQGIRRPNGGWTGLKSEFLAQCQQSLFPEMVLWIRVLLWSPVVWSSRGPRPQNQIVPMIISNSLFCC